VNVYLHGSLKGNVGDVIICWNTLNYKHLKTKYLCRYLELRKLKQVSNVWYINDYIRDLYIPHIIFISARPRQLLSYGTFS
jgi:hypothetical protein